MSRKAPIRRAFVFFFLMSLNSLSSCSLPDETAATVNGRPIATEELEAAYGEFLAQFEEVVPPGGEEGTIKKSLLDRLIGRELMLQEAEGRGLRPDDAEVLSVIQRLQGEFREKDLGNVLSEAGIGQEEWKKRIADDLALEKIQEESVYKQITVSEKDIDEYLELHRGSDERPEEVRASQILVRTREEASEASKRIRGGESFASVAEEISLSPDAENGGDLGYFARGQMPQEFDAVVFSLRVGTLSPVVETTYGHHLFLVTDRREAHPRSEESIRDEVRRLLVAQEREKVYRAWLSGLREKADIRYNTDIVSP